MMASGEICFSYTTMRRMPVLAQSQAGASNAGVGQSQGATPSQIDTGPSADGTPAIVVTAQSQANTQISSPLAEGPLLAQDPMVDFFLENGGRVPNAADYMARYSKYGTGTQVPNPLPPVPPQNPWILFWQLVSGRFLDFWDFNPSILLYGPCNPSTPCGA
jgi:hypothetical protein